MPFFSPKRKLPTRTEKRQIVVDNRPVNLIIYFEARNNCRVSIGKTGVHIRIANFLSKKEQQRQIDKFTQWAIDKLEATPSYFEKPHQRQYKNGDELTIGGKTFKLFISKKATKGSSGKIHGENLFLEISGYAPEDEQREHTATLISRLVGHHFQPIIRQRLEELNAQFFNRPFKQVRLKNNSSNWGSCSGRGNINISTRLLFAPPDVIDYVLIHELAHLIQPNHSPAFWKLVSDAMPDYKEKEKWLKGNGKMCRF